MNTKKVSFSRTFNPFTMTEPERGRLLGELLGLCEQIFSGVSQEEFEAYILRKKAFRTKVRVFYGDDGKPVGFNGVHIFEKKSNDKKTTAVFRAEAGLLPDYRRRGTTLSLSYREFLRYRALHPRRNMYYLGVLVHPSSYHLVCRHSPVVYPSYACITPPEVEALIMELGEYFDLEKIQGEIPLVRFVGWKVNDAKKDFDYWHQCNKPDVRYFLELNPNYLKGYGLLTLIPLTTRNLLRSFANHLAELARRRAWEMSLKLVGKVGCHY